MMRTVFWTRAEERDDVRLGEVVTFANRLGPARLRAAVEYMRFIFSEQENANWRKARREEKAAGGCSAEARSRSTTILISWPTSPEDAGEAVLEIAALAAALGPTRLRSARKLLAYLSSEEAGENFTLDEESLAQVEGFEQGDTSGVVSYDEFLQELDEAAARRRDRPARSQ